MLKILFLTIIPFLPLLIGKRIDLGTLHDCTSVTPIGVFQFPELNGRKHDMKANKDDITTLEGTVSKYSPKVTKFNIYLCALELVSQECDDPSK